MKGNYNIVVISVNSTLTKAFQQAMNKKGLHYPIYEANMESAAQIVRRLQQDAKIRVFITRGRTYTYLCECTSATLVNVKSSFLPYLSIIQHLHERGIQKIAILGFSDQFRHNADRVGMALGENVSFFAYNWREYSDEALRQLFRGELLRLKKDGFEAFIGGSQIHSAAQELGLLCIENYPDDDLVEAALDEAGQIAASILAREEKNQTISAFLEIVPEILLKIDRVGTIVDYNFAAEKTFGIQKLNGNISKLFPNLEAASLLDKAIIQHDVLLTSNEKKLIADLSPIMINSEYSGAVISARPIDEIQKLEQNIRAKLSQKGLVAKTNFTDIHGSSEAIRQAVDWAKKIAKADGTVLITGETGTGKELFAQSIHNYSARAKAPFVAINCASLSPSVLESELFGYVKGAFTGALSDGKQGIFELAHKGTIFLDEIGELPMDIQAKLLRVIQEKEIVRIGDTKVIPIDVRVVAATNRNLEEDVKKRRFRSDLFYRLNVLTLNLPVLEERREDIPFLARFFLVQEKEPHEFTQDALEYLKNAAWPGNVRQLKNHVERASVFVDHYRITANDLERILRVSSGAAFSAASDQAAERERIESALRSAAGNRAAAAELLGISAVTLWRRMKKYDMLQSH